MVNMTEMLVWSAVVVTRGSVLYFLVVEMSTVNMTEMSVWSAVVVTRGSVLYFLVVEMSTVNMTEMSVWSAVVATRGSVLYFLVVEMSMVNTMYQTSLKQFLGVFDISMARSVKSPINSKRINNIIEYLTFECFKYTARGLYEVDKFLFTILMTLKIQLQMGQIRSEEFACFIKGIASRAHQHPGVYRSKFHIIYLFTV